MVAFAAMLLPSLLVPDACAHDHVKCLSAAQLRESSLVCNAVKLFIVISLRQAQRENCQVQEIPQLLECPLMFLAVEVFSSCASNCDGVVRVIVEVRISKAARYLQCRDA